MVTCNGDNICVPEMEKAFNVTDINKEFIKQKTKINKYKTHVID